MLDAIGAAKAPGATDAAARAGARAAAQGAVALDFVAAENSMGFHAPAEAARILAESIDYARQAELAARALGPAPGGAR